MTPQANPGNSLFYGDNLEILREYIPDESVDLIYLDPPFNSDRNYNVLFKDESGLDSEAQVTAFKDTWHWGPQAEAAYYELVTGDRTPEQVSRTIGALRDLIGSNQMMAYLVMMAIRLVELRRILKPTGSLYLHCDPTASHYLKVLLDAIFGAQNFRNELIWKRSHPHGNVSRTYGAIHDTLFFYTKSDNYLWNQPHKPYFLENGELDPEIAGQVLSQYNLIDEETGRRFQATSLLNPNPNRPNLTYEYQGHTRVWRWTQERMAQAEREGKIYIPKGGKGVPREKRYLDEQEGIPLQDMWDDITISSKSERLGYPTQKPLALLERIIEASSSPGDIVLDPFCGCGTAIAAAQKLERRWIGIDITHLAIALQKYRLEDMFNIQPGQDYAVIGEPVSLGSAYQLAQENRFQFQFWALSLVRAKPLGAEVGSRAGKRGKDRGIDGVINFIDESTGKPKRVLVQVKSGRVKSGDIRDLVGTVDREGAAIGVFITLEPPSKDMITEAVSAGFYESPHWGSFPKIQILTIESLLEGAQVKMPPQRATFKQAQRAQPPGPQQNTLFSDE